MPSQVAKARHLAERFGGERGGEFCPGGVPISRLAAEYGTPFYLYHGGILADSLRRVRASLGAGIEVLYSIKANPSFALCQLLAQQQAGAEVASAGELILARAAGFTPENIVFAGPGKTDEELHLAVQEAIFAVNVESLNEVDRLAGIAQSQGTVAGVGLRVNPTEPLMGSQMRMGGGASQFGIDQADLREAILTTAAHRSLLLRGVHVYTATQVFNVEALVAHCRNVVEIGLDVAAQSGRPLAMIDFGGGFGVPYFDNMKEFDLDRFGRELQRLLTSYSSDRRLAGCRFIFELGRYLVAEAGVYVTRVVDVKRSQGRTFLIADGGMNHHLSGTGNFGQVFRKPFPLLNLSRMEAQPRGSVALAGPCCTPLDLFGTDIALPKTEVGDLIGVFYSGAYGLSASSLLFLSHPTPAEVLLWEGRAHLLRPAGKAEDVLSGQRPLAAPASEIRDR